MNSTQTDSTHDNSTTTTNGVEPSSEAGEKPATENPLRKMRRTYNTARVWMAVLEQSEWWVPRGAWEAFATASLKTYTVTPDFTVDGIVAVADMDVPWRQNVTNFLWRKAQSIVAAHAWNGMIGFGGGSPYADPRQDVEDRTFLELSRDETARRAWFDQRPLIATLRETIITDRQARIPSPALLDAFFPPVPCAYCGKPTPPDQAATASWLWPGKGQVTNCKSCAGIVTCGRCGKEYDGAERRARDGDLCLDCD